ncbi:hypothetical protein GM661_04820 [Iocasia frigidifontis]|uniref:Uncharacterized protein n=1 Tax=Iocasia fonsfrigidae TaxID=2682810 RepID=A0A8A7K6L4_9FIRM|nr:hypothetical protein [Iocasia fonsfrigidae]QTL97356.1 hypothetical protein GM661_04820 [Iocasia fonsfrigidae]
MIAIKLNYRSAVSADRLAAQGAINYIQTVDLDRKIENNNQLKMYTTCIFC